MDGVVVRGYQGEASAVQETARAWTQEPVVREAGMARLEQIKIVNELLLEDQPQYQKEAKRFPQDEVSQRRLMRSLMNVCYPRILPKQLLKAQDELLRAEREEKGIVHVADLPAAGADPRIKIWQGDITRIDADAIVNAANSQMLGCFVPCHGCIDNAIHSAAGLQLREECASYMARMRREHGEDYEEPAGNAVITAGYNLPAKHVIHTVGPIIYGRLTKTDERLLASCYRSCLRLAAKEGLESIAFCCVSTGEVHFPNKRAAEIAVETVEEFLKKDARIETVVFNVYKDLDAEIYHRLLDRRRAKMFGRNMNEKAQKTYEESLDRLRNALSEADAVIVGVGSGLSTAAGFTYIGERFEKYFGDFAEKYSFRDMYSGGFYPYRTLEEYWAFWSRYIWINRYAPVPKDVHEKLLGLVGDKDYFVLSTNVDHAVLKGGFDKKRLFYTQGDYGLFQSVRPHGASKGKTYDNEETVRRMVLSQGYEIAHDGNLIIPDEARIRMAIDTELIPVCPDDGEYMVPNLRSDDTFVEDEGWHVAAGRYGDFLAEHGIRAEGFFTGDSRAKLNRAYEGKILFLELGVGANTPGIIKYPFWRMTAAYHNATYACLNMGEAFAPREIANRSILLDEDIAKCIEDLRK